MADRVCRWGILGTANIARKNWRALRSAPNASLVAVASRDRRRAEAFVADCQREAPLEPPPDACGSYQQLLERPDVDALYVPLPTGIRTSWILQAVEAGKHVLGEKPAGTDASDVSRLLEACRQHNVQYMDGVMFMHSARLAKMRELLDDGETIGDVRRVASQFSFLGADDFQRENIRVHSQLEPLGVLGDLGWYNIRFSLWAMNWQLPQAVSARLLAEAGRADSPSPVPIELSAELFFEGGASASFFCSFLVENQQWASVSGTRGELHLRDFVLPRFGAELEFDVARAVFDVRGCDFNMQDRSRRYRVTEYSNGYPGSQEANMIQRFSAIVLSGAPEPFWGEVALKTQQVLDACLSSARNDGRLTPVG